MTGGAPAAPGGPRWLGTAEAIAASASRRLATLGVAGMIAVAVVIVFDALMRKWSASPVHGLNEIISLIFAALVVACLPYTVSAGVQLVIDLLEARMSAGLRAVLEAIGELLSLAFIAIITWNVLRFGAELAGQGRVTIILRWPEPPFMVALGTLFGLTVLAQLLVALRASLKAYATLSAAGDGRAALRSVVVWLAVVAAAVAYVAWDFRALSAVMKANPITTTMVGLLLLWALLLARIPLGAAMGVLGVLGCMFLLGAAPALSALGTNVTGFLTNAEVSVLPLFLLMGSVAAVSGMAEDIYRLAHALLGGLRGGLALATIGGCAGFGAVTGSSVATIATIGKAALPEMRQRGYAPPLIMGCIAAGGTLGQLVPPSTAIIVYALLTEQSIGRLFVGEVVPAIIAVALYFVAIALYTRMNPGSAPPAERPALAEIMRAARGAAGAIALFVLVIGGLYSGIFTANESAAVGVVGAFLYAVLRGRIRPATFWTVMAESSAIMGMIYLLIIGAITFSFFVGVSGLPEKMAAWAGGLNINPLALIAVILLIYLALGCVMDSFGVMIITTPIIAPLVAQAGYDLVWWGVVMVVVVETGMITPPFGLNIFMLKSMSDVPLATIYRGVAPFVVADLIKLALMVLVPATVLWLPSTMF